MKIIYMLVYMAEKILVSGEYLFSMLIFHVLKSCTKCVRW